MKRILFSYQGNVLILNRSPHLMPKCIYPQLLTEWLNPKGRCQGEQSAMQLSTYSLVGPCVESRSVTWKAIRIVAVLM